MNALIGFKMISTIVYELSNKILLLSTHRILFLLFLSPSLAILSMSVICFGYSMIIAWFCLISITVYDGTLTTICDFHYLLKEATHLLSSLIFISACTLILYIGLDRQSTPRHFCSYYTSSPISYNTMKCTKCCQIWPNCHNRK